MKQYIGIIVVLLGALCLVLHYCGVWHTNACLVTGVSIVVLGILSYILINKFLK